MGFNTFSSVLSNQDSDCLNIQTFRIFLSTEVKLLKRKKEKPESEIKVLAALISVEVLREKTHPCFSPNLWCLLANPDIPWLLGLPLVSLYHLPLLPVFSPFIRTPVIA